MENENKDKRTREQIAVNAVNLLLFVVIFLTSSVIFSVDHKLQEKQIDE